MTPKTKKLVLDALHSRRGDDLERATYSFRGMDMTKEHGQSGKTRQQILDGYIKDRNEVMDAIREVEDL